MLENVSPYNLDIAPKVGSSQLLELKIVDFIFLFLFFLFYFIFIFCFIFGLRVRG